MKVTKFTGYNPAAVDAILSVSSTTFVSAASNALDSSAIGGVTPVNSAQSNWHLVAYSSNFAEWRPDGGGAAASVSFGSNSMSVNDLNVGGASSDSARADHRHLGIATITASSSNTMQRPTVNLRPGTNISFGLTNTDGDGSLDTLTIHNVATAGLLNKYNGTVAPTTGDDFADGYSVGSVWVDTTHDDAYICVDATVGAAVWNPFDSGAGSASGGSGGATPYDTFGTMQIFAEANNAWGTASSWDVASRALYIPFVTPADITCNKLWYVTGGTTTGAGTNIDIGVYSAAGSRLISTGTTAYNQNNNNTMTVIDVADTALVAQTLYYLAFVSDSTGSGVKFNAWDTGANGSSFLGTFVQTSAIPLPSTATMTRSTTGRLIPMIGIAARSETV